MKLNGNTWTVGILIPVLLLGLIVTPQMISMRKYNQARNNAQSQLPPPFRVLRIDAQKQERLEDIEARWTCKNIEINGPHALAMRTLGLEPSVTNLVNLLTLRIPPYDWLRPKENKRNLEVALVQTTILPISVDQSIHLSGDGSIALIEHPKGVVSIFRETEEGFQEALWAESAPAPAGSSSD